eukprot:TRINITY_DN42177_c0_g1_i3.p1 TRINITY_DN42177_c0_g1~~TRINITY_DN42177_c0_g1_i3.p1  ORF type:complete len:105 (+),score=4.91 TRINITY_DN42177_c0_g1_i3:177-491(+)
MNIPALSQMYNGIKNRLAYQTMLNNISHTKLQHIETLRSKHHYGAIVVLPSICGPPKYGYCGLGVQMWFSHGVPLLFQPSMYGYCSLAVQTRFLHDGPLKVRSL